MIHDGQALADPPEQLPRTTGNAGLIAWLIVAAFAAFALGVWSASSGLRDLAIAREPEPRMDRAQIEALQRANLCRGSVPSARAAGPNADGRAR